MFRAPTNCKFFRIVNDSVEVNDLVSLNSVSLVGHCSSLTIFRGKFTIKTVSVHSL